MTSDKSKEPKLFLKLPFGQYGLTSTLFNKKLSVSPTPKTVGHGELCPCCCWKPNTDRVGKRMWSVIAEDYKAYKFYRSMLKALQNVRTLVDSNENGRQIYMTIKSQAEIVDKYLQNKESK